MGRNKNTVKEKSESLSVADKEAGVGKKILRIDVPSRGFMNRLRHKVTNKCSERVKKFTTKLTKSKFPLRGN
jgi:hypothetical protein